MAFAGNVNISSQKPSLLVACSISVLLSLPRTAWALSYLCETLFCTIGLWDMLKNTNSSHAAFLTLFEMAAGKWWIKSRAPERTLSRWRRRHKIESCQVQSVYYAAGAHSHQRVFNCALSAKPSSMSDINPDPGNGKSTTRGGCSGSLMVPLTVHAARSLVVDSSVL